MQSMATIGRSTHKPDPGIIFDSLNAYQRSAALKAAIELNLFTEIARGNRSTDAIAKASAHRLAGFAFFATTSSSADFL